ncbi:MAG: GAF domain-containing protein [Terriglobia bacterium]
MSRFAALLEEIGRLAGNAQSAIALQRAIVQAVAKNLAHYNWVGFYMLDPEDASMLVLGPFHGEPTEHTHIPVTQGICGLAVARNETVVVEDVASDPRYLSCSLDTRSEIVTPIRVRGRVLGEIDVDSHALNAFHDEDREFLEKCADIVGHYMEQMDEPGSGRTQFSS